MPALSAVEIWTDVQCNGGSRVVAFALADLGGAVSTLAVHGDEEATFFVVRDDERAAAILQGRVARFLYGADFDEWRIADIFDDGTGGEGFTRVRCNPISADLARAVYTDESDALGIPYHDWALVETDGDGVLAGPVADALAAAGLSYIVPGTVDSAATFDVGGDYMTARQIIESIRTDERAGALEFRLRRNGTSDYRIDLLEAVGATEPTLYLRTANNLRTLRRKRLLSDLCTRVIPRGAQDATHRGIGYAFWEVAAVDTSVSIDLIDPRGGDYPGPARFADQLNGWYAAALGVAFASEEITDTVVVDAQTTRLSMADTSAFSVGGYVEFRLESGADGVRAWYLDNPAAQATFGGVFDRILPKDYLTGAVNYVPNGDMSTWSNSSNPPDGYSRTDITGTPTHSRETTITRFGGFAHKTVLNSINEQSRVNAPDTTVYDDTGYSWQFWVWCRIDVNNGITVQFHLRRIDNDSSILSTDTYGVAAGTVLVESGEWFALLLETDAVGAAGGGVYPSIDMTTTSGATGAVYLDAFGCMPLEWTRRDLYGPTGMGRCANDLWHAGNDYLEDTAAVAQYECSIIDLESANPSSGVFDGDAVKLGQTVSLIDTQLGITTTQRILQMTRNHVTNDIDVVMGTPAVSFAQMQRQRTRVMGKPTNDEVRSITLAVADQLIAGGAAVAAGTLTEVPETGNIATTSRDLGKVLKSWAVGGGVAVGAS